VSKGEDTVPISAEGFSHIDQREAYLGASIVFLVSNA
jgi:hypothetical protein